MTLMFVSTLFAVAISACAGGEDISGTAGMMIPRAIGGQVGHPMGANAVGPGVGEVAEPVAGARVDLFRDVDDDGECEPTPVDIAFTDATGIYLFDNLDEGSYCIGAAAEPSAALDAGDISATLDISASATEGQSIDITIR